MARKKPKAIVWYWFGIEKVFVILFIFLLVIAALSSSLRNVACYLLLFLLSSYFFVVGWKISKQKKLPTGIPTHWYYRKYYIYKPDTKYYGYLMMLAGLIPLIIIYMFLNQ